MKKGLLYLILFSAILSLVGCSKEDQSLPVSDTVYCKTGVTYTYTETTAFVSVEHTATIISKLSFYNDGKGLHHAYYMNSGIRSTYAWIDFTWKYDGSTITIDCEHNDLFPDKISISNIEEYGSDRWEVLFNGSKLYLHKTPELLEK